MGVTPLTFTGTSTYASDFQSILTRAVNIANVPLQELENTDATDLSKKTQLGGLNSAVAALTNAVQALGSLGSSQAITATSSGPASLAVTASGANANASYTVNSITSLASQASETSLNGFQDSSASSVSVNRSMSLVVGSNTYAINLAAGSNNLVGLENSINSLNAGVTASILTTGNGNYLSVSANAPGATTLQLIDDPGGASNNILTNANQGTNAVFQLNNLNVTRPDNTIDDLVPGLTLTLKAPSTTPITITMQSDPSQMESALQDFATAYNAVVQQVDAQTGINAGVLVGDPALLQLQSTMRSVTGFQTTGSIQNLAGLGITLGTDGTMTFDPTVIGSLSTTQLSSAFQVLGSQTTGFGALSRSLSALSDPIQGSIANEENTFTQEDVQLQQQIAQSTASINSMQQTLLSQLSKSDSLITSLTSQQNLLTASVQSLNYVMYGKSVNS